jgi:ABC-2 type transport system permease protein
MTAALAEQPGRTHAPVSRLLRSELRWVFRRPRTLVSLALLALIPVIVGIAIKLTDDTTGADGSLFTIAAGNGLVLPVIALSLAIGLLLPLITAMSAADAIAGEAQFGTLRGLLLAPVGRGRLLVVKAFGVASVAVVGSVLIAVVGVITGWVLVGSDGMVTLSGNTLSTGEGLARVGLAVLWVTFQMWAVGAIALAISALTDHPLVVMAITLAGAIVFAVLSAIPALDWLRPFLLTETWLNVTDVVRDPMPWSGLLDGVGRAACYLVIGLSIAWARLSTKDG